LRNSLRGGGYSKEKNRPSRKPPKNVKAKVQAHIFLNARGKGHRDDARKGTSRKKEIMNARFYKTPGAFRAREKGKSSHGTKVGPASSRDSMGWGLWGAGRSEPFKRTNTENQRGGHQHA